MFESKERLGVQVGRLLDGLRGETGARYAAVIDPTAVLFESHAEDEGALRLHHFLERRRGDLFAIPRAMATEEPMEDVFEEWREDEFLLAFFNGRVALVLACADAEAARARLGEGLKALADRLFRFEPRWRMDARGRGYFFGRAKVDVVVVGRPEGAG